MVENRCARNTAEGSSPALSHHRKTLGGTDGTHLSAITYPSNQEQMGKFLRIGQYQPVDIPHADGQKIYRLLRMSRVVPQQGNEPQPTLLATVEPSDTNRRQTNWPRNEQLREKLV